MPTSMPREGEVQTLLFTVPVNNASEDAPKLSVSYLDRPGDWLGTVLWFVGALLLLIAAFRRASGRGAAWVAIGLALVLLAAKVVGWGFDDSEAWLTAVGVAVAAVAGLVARMKARWAAHTAERDNESDKKEGADAG